MANVFARSVSTQTSTLNSDTAKIFIQLPLHKPTV